MRRAAEGEAARASAAPVRSVSFCLKYFVKARRIELMLPGTPSNISSENAWCILALFLKNNVKMHQAFSFFFFVENPIRFYVGI